MRHPYAFVLIFLLSVYGSNAQTKTIDRLKQNVQSAITEDEKLKAILDLCDQGYSLHPDTLLLYAQKGKKIAIEQKNVHEIAKAMYYESFALTNKGLIDSSLSVANQCLKILSSKINDGVLLGNVLNQKGRCYMRKNQYKEAIDMAYHVINNAEKIRDTLMQVKGKTLIGWAYLEMGQPKEALKWHLNAFKTTDDSLLLDRYAVLFGNLALNYNGLGKKDSAFYFINKSIRGSRKHENLFALSNALAIQAQLYVTSGQGKLAVAPLKEVVEIRKLIGDPFYIISDMSQLSLYYAHNGQPQKGIALCNEGIAIAKKYKMDTKLFFLYSTLAENYKAFGNPAKYAEVLEKIILLKDSVYQSNSANALAEMQTKYDLQKKETIIISQKLDLVSKNYWLYASLLAGVFGIIISYLIFKNYRRKQKIIFLSMRAEEKQIAYHAVLTAEENERKRIAADLHDNMGAYAAAIIANADELMASKKNGDNTLVNNLKENAGEIMRNLRDTIWASNKEKILLTGISDRFKNYIQKIMPAYPNTNIEVFEKIETNISFPPVYALNIFRILQEALSNALRHSGATSIQISFISTQEFKISISDNGKGINNSDFTKTGNGINNMKSRAIESGYRLFIHKKEEGGSEITISI